MFLRLCWGTTARSTRPTRFLLTACALAVAGPVWAQQSTELPPIVVEGATLEAPKAVKKTTSQASAPVQGGTTGAEVTGTGKADADTQASDGVPIEQIGAAVTVVTRKDLENRQIRYAADALRSLPGVEVSQSGGIGNLTQMRIRGAEANQTLASSTASRPTTRPMASSTSPIWQPRTSSASRSSAGP